MIKKQLFILLLLLPGIAVLAQENHLPVDTVHAKPVAYPNAPEITFAETTYDFGKLQRGSSVACKFLYKNTGKESLILRDCKAGCICTSVKCLKEPLGSGETGSIEVRYDSTRVGVFTKDILVSSNARTPVVILNIKGNIEDINSGQKK